MKTPDNPINRISITLNIVLAAGCAFLLIRHSAQNQSPLTQSAAPSIALRASTLSSPAQTITQEKLAPSQPRPWLEVLRGQGVPEKVIARLAIADFEDRWQSRQARAQEAYNRGDLDADGLAALARQHDIEQETDLRARLGEDAYREWDAARLFQQFNLSDLNLTAGETNSLYDLAAGLRQHLRELEKARAENQIDQATFNSEQAEAETNFQNQVRTLLGDDRYGAIHGTDPSVGDLRRSLRGLIVDDQQFATLLQTQQQWDAARAQLQQQFVETSNTNLQQQLSVLTSKRDEAFANILGTNGLALYLKQQDSRYVEMEKNAAQWDLDVSNIDSIYDAIQAYDGALMDYQRKARELEARGIKIDPEKSQQQWRDYENQMAQYVRGNLTEARYQAITRNQILPFAGQ